MRKQLFAVAILFTVLTGCKSKSAFNFSEEITAKEKSLVPYITTTQSSITSFGAAQQFDSVAVVAEKMEKRVQEKLDEINAMKVPSAKGAQDFKNEAIVYFKYIKSLYTGYKNIGLAKTPEERQQIINDVEKLENERIAVLTSMQAAQRKYASDNGFKIQ